MDAILLQLLHKVKLKLVAVNGAEQIHQKRFCTAEVHHSHNMQNVNFFHMNTSIATQTACTVLLFQSDPHPGRQKTACPQHKPLYPLGKGLIAPVARYGASERPTIS